MMGRAAALLPCGKRLHLQHGPIDLIIGADGDRKAGFHAAQVRFSTVLQELVDELPLLRSNQAGPARGAIARRMQAAVRSHQARSFVTPMAAVAGAVAQEVLDAMVRAAPMTRAYVNNGGDIALHLAGAARYRAAMAGPDGTGLGTVSLDAASPVRGIATSGRGGRSLSLGIADSVTVLATTAAGADVAATLIANAVDLPGHGAVRRVPAYDLDPDSDLGSQLVTLQVGGLTPDEVNRALARGAGLAREMHARGLICAAALFLRGQARLEGDTHRMIAGEMTEHA